MCVYIDKSHIRLGRTYVTQCGKKNLSVYGSDEHEGGSEAAEIRDASGKEENEYPEAWPWCLTHNSLHVNVDIY